MRTVIVSSHPVRAIADLRMFATRNAGSFSELHSVVLSHDERAPGWVWTGAEPRMPSTPRRERALVPGVSSACSLPSEEAAAEPLNGSRLSGVIRHAQRFVMVGDGEARLRAQVCRQARWLRSVNRHADYFAIERDWTYGPDGSIVRPGRGPLTTRPVAELEVEVAPVLISAHMEARFALRFWQSQAGAKLAPFAVNPARPYRSATMSFLELRTLPHLVDDARERERAREVLAVGPLDARSTFGLEPGSADFEAVQGDSFAKAWSHMEHAAEIFGLAVSPPRSGRRSRSLVLTSEGRAFLSLLAPTFFDAEFVERRRRWIADGFEKSLAGIDAYVDAVCDAQEAFERGRQTKRCA